MKRSVWLILLGICLLVGMWQISFGQKPELVVQAGHSDEVTSVSFSPNKKYMISGSGDKSIKLWNVKTGQQVRTLTGHSGWIFSVAFSPDGKQIVSGSADKSIKLWNVETGQQVRTLTGRFGWIFSVAFSHDGKQILSGHSDKLIRLWNVETGQLVRTFFGHSSQVSSVAFSPDGKQIVSGSADNSIKLWNVATGRQIRTFKGHSDGVNSVAFFPDGKQILSGSEDKSLKLWNVETGELIRTFSGHSDGVNSVVFSSDGKQIVSGSSDNSIKLWNVATGRQIRTFKGHSDAVSEVAFLPDSKQIVSGSRDKSIRFWNVETGQQVKTLTGHSGWIFSVAISSDGKQIDREHIDKSIKLWNVITGQQIRTLTDHSDWFFSAVFLRDISPDGKQLVNTIRVDDDISENSIKLWNIDTGQEIRTLTDHSDSTDSVITSVAFSPDGKQIVSGSWDNSIKLWNVNSGQEIRTFTGHSGQVSSIAFSPDGKQILSVDFDTKIKIWNKETGKELVSLIAIDENDWLVTTPDGLFDGSPNAWKQLLWRFDNNTFNYAPVEAFFKEFYYPGLLQEIMAGKTPKPPEKDLSQVDIRQPTLKISEIDNKLTDSNSGISANQATVKVKVEITDNTNKGRKESFPALSGANDVRLFRNGSLVKLWEKNVFELGEKDGCRQIAATKDIPRKALCETEVQITADKNEFTAYAFNHDNVKSNDATAQIKGADALKRKGKIQILSVGVNEYQNSKYNLKFAVPDAVDFGAELRKQQINLKNYDAPEVVQLTDNEATKRNIIYALERFAKGEKAVKPQNLSSEIEKKFAAIEKTQPEDVLVIYFAGHGTASKDRFYLIPADGFPTEYANEQSRLDFLQKQSISDLELETTLRDLDAGQILFVIDACNSGQALEAEEKRRGPMNSRGLAQLAFEKGMYILTAAQSFQAALEVSRTRDGKKIEHGLLTFSLIEGLIDPKADNDGNKSIIEREWFSFAVAEVPRMQLEEMQKRNAELKQGNSPATKRSDLVFLDGEDKNLPPEKRGLQTPRIFYRREVSVNPLIISKP